MMTLPSNLTIIDQTLNWIRSFIIPYNLCPFAKKVILQNSLRIQVCSATQPIEAVENIMAEVHYLDEHPKTETTLLVFADGFQDFFTYLDLVDSVEQMVYQLEYEGIYQVATFHPDYYFADTEPQDVTNYTNRSPYPMIHLLREESLDKAIDTYGDTANIPVKNAATLQKLGIEAIKKILQQIKPE